MRTINKFDQVTRETKRVTLLRVVETNTKGKETDREMNIRHALQAMRVHPTRFKLAPGEVLPKGISIDMVPLGTTMKDVEEFEKKRGKVGKLTRTNLDNILDAIENGIELQDVEVFDADPNAKAGSMMSDDAPDNYIPVGVDLEPAESMKDPDQTVSDTGKKSTEEAAFDKSTKGTPELNEIKEKELSFESQSTNANQYTKESLKNLPKDKLQAILSSLPAFKNKNEKMQKTLLKGKVENLIETIVQLSKFRAKQNE